MFKIEKLVLFGVNNKMFIYNFSEGINYFKGKNSSGKTEFYLFIDFMFGSSGNIFDKPWYKGSLFKAEMLFEYNKCKYFIARTSNPEVNYFRVSDDENVESVDFREYKNKLNSVFAQDLKLLKSIRYFTDEDLTYRTFTMFNFLGEKGQGMDRLH